MPLTVKQVLDYSALTLLQTGDLSTTARRITDFIEASGDYPAPFSTATRVALEQIFVEEVSRGRIEWAFAIALGIAKVDIPLGLGFDLASYPISPRLTLPADWQTNSALTPATGTAGVTPEELFDARSNARLAPANTYYVGQMQG